MPERGALIAIGGHEDHEGEQTILRAVAAHLGGRPLALVTAGSQQPEAYIERYTRSFGDLGVEVVPVPLDEGAAAVPAGVGGVFMTGGKQTRLVGRLKEHGIDGAMRRLWEDGGVVAGTSAGASAIAGHMILNGAGEESPAGTAVDLGTALGLLEGVLIDQHFAERGRSGRLRAAVASEPSCIGLGLDEDTAIEVRGREFTVLGSSAVTVIDARRAQCTKASAGRPATLRDATFHVLADGDRYTLPEV